MAPAKTTKYVSVVQKYPYAKTPTGQSGWTATTPRDTATSRRWTSSWTSSPAKCARCHLPSRVVPWGRTSRPSPLARSSRCRPARDSCASTPHSPDSTASMTMRCASAARSNRLMCAPMDSGLIGLIEITHQDMVILKLWMNFWMKNPNMFAPNPLQCKDVQSMVTSQLKVLVNYWPYHLLMDWVVLILTNLLDHIVWITKFHSAAKREQSKFFQLHL